MSGWMLAAGRAGGQTLITALPAGVKTIGLTNADLIFAVGQRLFASAGDGSGTQWLGRVTAVDPMSVSFSRAVKTALGSGALLWRAATALDFLEESIVIRRREIRPGVVTECSQGGQFYAIQLATPQAMDDLVFSGLSDKLETALLDWLDGTLAWGLVSFTLIAPDGSLRIARLTGESLRRERNSRGEDLWIVPIITEAEGAYA